VWVGISLGLTACDATDLPVATVSSAVACDPAAAVWPIQVSGSDFAADHNVDQTWAGPDCEPALGPEAIWPIDLLAGQRVMVRENTGHPMRFRLTTHCDSAAAACLQADPEALWERDDWTYFSVPLDGNYMLVAESRFTDPLQAPYDIEAAIEGWEDCDDGIDNDLDGAIDCDDFKACYDTDECPVTCPTDDVRTVPFVDSGSSFDDDYGSAASLPWDAGHSCGYTSSFQGGSALYQIELAEGERIRFSEESSMEAFFTVSDLCHVTHRTCFGTPDDTFTAPADGVYTLEMRTSEVSNHSSYELVVDLWAPEECTNGQDDDFDGLVDCDDIEDCWTEPSCNLECAPAAPVTLPFQISGSNLYDDFHGTEAFPHPLDCNGSTYTTAVFDVELLAGESIRIEQHEYPPNTRIDVGHHCDLGGVCLPTTELTDDSDVVFQAPMDGDYTVKVGAWYPSYPYDITIERVDAEDCSDGLDNDLDDYIDCLDTDCLGECGFTCPSVDLALPATLSGPSWAADYSGGYAWSQGAQCGALTDKTAVWTVDLAAGDLFEVTSTGDASFDVAILEDCHPSDTCLARDGYVDQMLFEAPADGSYTVVASAKISSQAYELNMRVVPDEDCGDLIDNDLDGLTDCDDRTDCGDVCPYTCPAQAVPLPWSVSGADMTVDYPANRDWSMGTDCSQASGSEAIFEVELLAGEVLRVSDYAEGAMRIRVLDQCHNGSHTCLADQAGYEHLTFVAPEDGTYFAVVEGLYDWPGWRSSYDIHLWTETP